MSQNTKYKTLNIKEKKKLLHIAVKILDYHIEKRPNILEQSMTAQLTILPFE